jgi:ABC-2 type transport system ATP-binding protein
MRRNGDLVIDTHGLSKSYNQVRALKSLDLKVRKHSIFGFLGPNGAGKTTTIKLLLGLARPSEGSANVFGYDIVNNSLEIRKRVGYLAQNPRFYTHMTARQILIFTARFFFSGPEPGIERRVSETLALVGLVDKADRPIKSFSGGELQRLGIAQAQVNNPDLLILDEPAASLDPMGRHDVLVVMERLRENATIFYSTHILDDVQRVSDTVAVLNKGKLVAQAPIEELLAGSGETTYTVVLAGNTVAARRQVVAQTWVLDVEEATKDDHTVWQVRVTDREAAEAQLLPLIMAGQSLTVKEFKYRQRNLEEIFLHIIGSDNHE